MWTTVIASSFGWVADLAWSIAGFVIGLAAGWVARAVFEIKEAVVPESTPRVERRRRSSDRTRILGVVVIVLAVFSVISASYQVHEQRQLAQCLATHNAAFADALQQRAEIADDDRAALTRMVRRVVTSTKARETLDALNDYLRTIREGAAEREQIPLPEDHCG